jgi:carboxypeptidase PM20D1
LSNVSLEYVLDEGSMVIENIIPGLDLPTASIGIAEKGYMTIKFFVNITGGHSSQPNIDESALISRNYNFFF